VSIDDFDFAAIMNPPPTVVAAPVAAMAERAIHSLLEEIDVKRRPSGVRQLFSPILIVRKSSRSPLDTDATFPTVSIVEDAAFP
jgi:DNA-binding LacI/PurR family transcriptional regulator